MNHDASARTVIALAQKNDALARNAITLALPPGARAMNRDASARNAIALAQKNDALARNANAFGCVARGLADLKILNRSLNLPEFV